MSIPNDQPSGVFENLGRKLDERPEMKSAEDAVRKAREQLAQAEAVYREVQEQAAEGIKRLRESKVKDVLDTTVETTLSMVRKHPGPGVVVAALCGFFLGRLFRR
jgi:ElaB/YqjD/DUF883 family membrane-anchored ribosome-binding protein